MPLLHIDWKCSPVSELSPIDLLDALAARQAVFICEQNCLYRDIDGLDPFCWHILGRDTGGHLAAYARILPPGVKFPEASIGRVLTQRAYRGVGLGRRLMRYGLEVCAQQFPDQPIRIAAQHHLQDYYGQFGFFPTGPVYEEDGIRHIDMLRCGNSTRRINEFDTLPERAATHGKSLDQ